MTFFAVGVEIGYNLDSIINAETNKENRHHTGEHIYLFDSNT
ncbi:hypothetical protein ES705_37726 [subsurface metagenome]